MVVKVMGGAGQDVTVGLCGKHSSRGGSNYLTVEAVAFCYPPSLPPFLKKNIIEELLSFEGKHVPMKQREWLHPGSFHLALGTE